LTPQPFYPPAVSFFAVQGASIGRACAAWLRSRRYPRGTLIFRQGDPCPGVFVVGSGLVRVYNMSRREKSTVLHPGQSRRHVCRSGRDRRL